MIGLTHGNQFLKVSKFIFEPMNGSFEKNILVRQVNDTFADFDYEFSTTIPKDRSNVNIIIDAYYEKVLWIEIIQNGIETLIFKNNKVLNIFQYMRTVIGVDEYSQKKIKKFCFISYLCKFVFKKLKINLDNLALLRSLDDSNYLKMDILMNIVQPKSTIPIDAKVYKDLEKKVLNFETLASIPDLQKSFIILFSSKIIDINQFRINL